MPKQSKSELPGPVPLVEWRDRISAALRYKYDEKLPPEHLERAINETYAAKCTLVERLGKTKTDLRPAEKQRQLNKPIRELQDCIRIIEQHFFAQPAPGINASFPRLENSDLTLDARIAWRDHQLEGEDKIRPVLEQFEDNVFDSPPAYEGLAHHVKHTLKVLGAVKAHYEYARTNKDYDFFGVGMWLPADEAKRLYIMHLMNIFCGLRGEKFQEVPIGNPAFDNNPLLRFLNAVSAPIEIEGERNLDIGWLHPSTLVRIATSVKKSATVG